MPSLQSSKKEGRGPETQREARWAEGENTEDWGQQVTAELGAEGQAETGLGTRAKEGPAEQPPGCTVHSGNGVVWGWRSSPQLWCWDTALRGTLYQRTPAATLRNTTAYAPTSQLISTQNTLALRKDSHLPTPAGSSLLRGRASQCRRRSGKSW